MKQMMTTLLMLLVVLTASAQEKKGDALNEKYFDAKVSELVYRLEMTDEQKAKFVPVYRRYCEEMRSTMGRHHRQGKPQTDEERLARTRQRMERQQQAQTIRLRYVDEFAKVLTASQVSRFYEVEGKIQKKLMERRKHHRGNGKFDGKKFDGKRRDMQKDKAKD